MPKFVIESPKDKPVVVKLEPDDDGMNIVVTDGFTTVTVATLHENGELWRLPLDEDDAAALGLNVNDDGYIVGKDY